MTSPSAPLPFPTARPAPPLSEKLIARGISLAPAQATDLPLLADLYAASRAVELLSAPWPPAQRRAFLDDQFQLQHRHYLQIHRRGDFWLVRFAHSDALPRTIGRLYAERSKPDWQVIDITLAPDTQGTGIGSALIGWLQQSAAAAGAEHLRLSVAINNPRARALYQRLGFSDCAPMTGTHWRMGWPVIRR